MKKRLPKRRAGARPFLSALARDVRGNTLMLVAAALIPLMAMIGSGVDMARGYMAQDQLQQACDAGVLAARRLLSGSQLTDAVNNEAKAYFNFNFPQGTYDAAAFTPVVTVPKLGTVRMTASTTIPTAIMGILGFKTMALSASCSATQDFVSTDIMLVLDMSGSMNCPPGQAGACNEVEQPGSKMAALRSAATSLYDTLAGAQNQLHANSLRLRYGFVPYNGTVNVGRILYAKNPDYIRGPTYPYQTRVWVPTTRTTTSFRSESDCAALGGTWSRFFLSLGYCTYQEVTGGAWSYGQYWVDVSRYVTGATVPVPTQTNGSTARWAGCIEERKTNNGTINGGSGTTAPADAWDLDVTRIPNSDDSRWGPWWPEVEFGRDATAQRTRSDYCASEASRLTEYYNNKQGFTNYLANLKPLGSTYHDIGMIWGARFIASEGIFAGPAETNDQFTADNPSKIRGFSVRKYLIFMTDGDLSPTLDEYSSYGIENLDKRVLGSAAVTGTNQVNRHLQRFRMACNAAKGQNIDVWVIAFSTTLTSEMQNCASSPSQAAGISTSADLIAKFQEIGSKIGSLRLSQ
ncbi:MULTISPECIES: TadE/TadG family type IV pilus assembly protein [Sphingomonas]|uniref:TadE/TadG family type IV pilus assembly protein n=1 Tax=Sphingomonas TaxID=13687 RepID=UPI000F7F45DB|nr:TadE/TadG family type IV pilus assembly protein [Sphingomonas sp. ABOLF]RSV13464.1 pilus assembly protein [Sphingomonas sp. ABOLF]